MLYYHTMVKNDKCKKCGLELSSSQYASVKVEGKQVVKVEEDLVCRNYPVCSEAEKDCDPE